MPFSKAVPESEADHKDYIALLPMDDIEAEDGEVYLYRYSEDEKDSRNLENIRGRR